MNFRGESLRLNRQRCLTSTCVIFLSLVLITGPDPTTAQCPSSIPDSFIDIHVGASTEFLTYSNPTVGISVYDDNAIIVAYEFGDPDAYGTEIVAARYSADGMLYPGDPFAVTEPNPEQFGEDPPLSIEISEDKHDPSLAVSPGGIVSIAFTGSFQGARYRYATCSPGNPCQEQFNCEANCTYGVTHCNDNGWCYYGLDGETLLNGQFGFNTPPTPMVIPVLVGIHRSDFGPSAGHSVFAWRNDGLISCANDAPFGWLIGSSWNNTRRVKARQEPRPPENATAE